MTISTIRQTTRFFMEKEGEIKKEPEIKEKTLCEFKTTNEVATTFLNMLDKEYMEPQFNKDGDMEFVGYIESSDKIREMLIIKFSNK